MPDIPTDAPAVIIAGSSYSWTKSIPDYLPVDGWALSYAVHNGTNNYALVGADNGDGAYLVSLSAVDTGAYAAGEYYYQAFVSKGSERVDVGSGELTIKPDPLGGPVDGRSLVKQTLDAINQTILGVSSKQNESYSVDGVSVTRMNKTDLLMAKKQYETWYRQEQDAERMAKGLGRRSKVRVRL